MFDFESRFTEDRLREFAHILKDMSRQIGFKVSSRGWGYLLESARYINKNQFDKVESLVNKCRKLGYLPVDFVAEESSRAFSGVETESDRTVKGTLTWMLRDVLRGHVYYTPNWWEGEEYYVQMVVEKIDLVTLFEPVCKEYHIPIANSKGWSSILQRAEYCRRFAEAEQQGLKCVLLYCGDHDPDGLRISDTLRENLRQISDVRWHDGFDGYDPRDLEITRFGLNFDFIEANNYTWIDNLITGSNKDLASPSHPNFRLPYVQEYLATVGERKCEANAVVTTPGEAQEMCREAIEAVLGDDAIERFEAKTEAVEKRYNDLLERLELREVIDKALEDTDDDEDED